MCKYAFFLYIILSKSYLYEKIHVPVFVDSYAFGLTGNSSILELYKQRFTDAMNRYFLSVPSKWSAFADLGNAPESTKTQG